MSTLILSGNVTFTFKFIEFNLNPFSKNWKKSRKFQFSDLEPIFTMKGVRYKKVILRFFLGTG